VLEELTEEAITVEVILGENIDSLSALCFKL
jgi:hypothetical protein